MMKKAQLTRFFITCTFLILAPPTYSGGLAVSDPISYTYYVQQLEQATSAVKKGKETVESLGGLRNQVDTMTSQFRGNYARLMGIVGAVGDLYQEVESIPSSIEAAEANFKSMIGDYEQYAKIDENLRKAFNDPRSAKYNPDVYLTHQYNVKQLSKKNVIRASEYSLAKQKKRIDALGEISGQIDKTENVKDATDLNNRFLAELIKGQLEMLAILTRLAKMEALDGYAGYEDDAANAASTTVKNRSSGRDDRDFKYTNWLLSHGAK
jgi:hypothetical protein